MNKPAAKEPSMDEILSSIRQIIADDDAATAPPPQASAPPPARPPVTAAPPPPPARTAPEPLALSPSQIMPAPVLPPTGARAMDFSAMLADPDESDEDPVAELISSEPELVDPEDIAFEAEPEPEPAPEPVAPPPPPPVMRAAPPPPRAPEPRQAPRPVAMAAPMPDPTLSRDMAEELLDPTTDAAVKGAMSRLNGLSSFASGQTIEGMMRDMLRPMLKEWLDENLPSLVERMVEKEIARVSRGVK